MNIQVGDLVTFKDNKDGASFIDIITRETIGQYYKKYLQKELEILKIERPKYEVVEEKKELLTEEEKEFLKNVCKYYDVTEIRLNNIDIKIINDGHIVSCLDYPDNMKFENLERGKRYTLEELGLEES